MITYAQWQDEGATPVDGIWLELDVTEQTFCAWKRKDTGLVVAELRRLKQLEREDERLERLVEGFGLD